MLIYDHDKKFVGIDEDDLRLLGFDSTEELLASASDIADFFVKKPGYIHNFKNFQWIDFVLHSDSGDSKAIINTGVKGFSCEIVIKPFHLIEAPETSAYAITLQHVKPLSSAEAAELGTAAAAVEPPQPEAFTPPPEAPAPEPEPVVSAEPEPPSYKAPQPAPEPGPMQNELPSFEDVAPTTLDEPANVEIPESDYDIPDHLHADFSKPLEIEDDIFMQEKAPAAAPEPDLTQEPAFEAPEIPEAPSFEEAAEAPAERVEKPMLGDYLTPQEQEYADQMKDFKDYAYDPSVAAEELGLPVDLIEEFIGDFITQAHDFRDELYEANSKEDFDNVKLLSHKLKGVAANLRIEDSFEMLKVINESHDSGEIEAYLKMFYRTIAKLEGKEVPELSPAAAAPVAEPAPEAAPSLEEPAAAAEPAAAPVPEAEEDIYNLDIKAAVPESEPETPAAAPADDDIYAFDIAPEPAPEAAEAPASDEPEDLYGFEAELPPMDETLTPEPEPMPEEPFAAQPETSPASSEPEDLYGFEAELPPMDESLIPEPEPMPEEPSMPQAEAAPAADEPEDLYAFDDELPPMDQTADTAATSPEPAAPIPPMNYSAATAASELGLPQYVVDELVNDFTDHAREVKAKLAAAVASGDQLAWRSEAIQMKGIADNLRMNEIAAALATLEAAGDSANAETALEQLYSRIEQL